MLINDNVALWNLLLSLGQYANCYCYIPSLVDLHSNSKKSVEAKLIELAACPRLSRHYPECLFLLFIHHLFLLYGERSAALIRKSAGDSIFLGHFTLATRSSFVIIAASLLPNHSCLHINSVWNLKVKLLQHHIHLTRSHFFPFVTIIKISLYFCFLEFTSEFSIIFSKLLKSMDYIV